MLGAADAKSGHVVEKKVSPVFNRERDDDIGLGFGKPKPELVIILKKVIGLLLGRGFRPGGHSRSMAGSTSEDNRHNSLQPLERFRIIFIGKFVEQCEWP